VTAGVFGQFLKGTSDAFVSKINATGSGFVFSTLLGGSVGDSAKRVVLDSSGNIYVAGTTQSTDFPVTPDAFKTSAQGLDDVFVAIIKNNGATLSYATYFGTNQFDSVGGFGMSSAGLFLGGAIQTQFSGQTANYPAFNPFDTSFAGSVEGFLVMFRPPGPGTFTGTVFNDGNQNGIKDGIENGAAGINVNVGGAAAALTDSNGNYSVSNLNWGSYQICVSIPATMVNTTSACRTSVLAPSSTVPNLNFGLIPKSGGVGVGSLQPATVTVHTGSHIMYAFSWVHPENWHLLDEVNLRFLDEFDQTILWIRFEEASNTFAVYNADTNDFGPPLTPGTEGTVETPFATLYLNDSTVQGSGPTGRSVQLNYDVSFKPAAANHSYRVMMMATDDDGVQEGWEPAGMLTVGGHMISPRPGVR
jgi:hypothetical protein